MNEETPVVDCHLSKDLAFARNIAAQMKEGYGRHNSNLTFRPGNRGTHMAEFRYSATPMREAMLPIIHVRENQQARVIGRIGNCSIRQQWQDCQIGDAVRTEDFRTFHLPEEGSNIVVLIKYSPIRVRYTPEYEAVSPQELSPQERFTFERVRTDVTNDNGITWREQLFWKRIS